MGAVQLFLYFSSCALEKLKVVLWMLLEDSN